MRAGEAAVHKERSAGAVGWWVTGGKELWRVEDGRTVNSVSFFLIPSCSCLSSFVRDFGVRRERGKAVAGKRRCDHVYGSGRSSGRVAADVPEAGSRMRCLCQRLLCILMRQVKPGNPETSCFSMSSCRSPDVEVGNSGKPSGTPLLACDYDCIRQAFVSSQDEDGR